MRKIALIAVAALSGGVALGQSLLDCIDPDVIRTLLVPGQGERPLVVTAMLPPEIAALKMPAGFAWIGSAERITGRVDATTNLSQVTAAWRSGLPPEAARTAAASALTASGWQIMARPGMGFGVFISTASTTMPQTACRDGNPVNLNAMAMEGVTYVTIAIQRGRSGDSSCNSPFPRAASSATGLEKLMPRLELPVDPATGRSARMQGSGAGSGGGAINARAEFAVKDSPASVARQFAKQMAAQGWTSDASWSGTSTAGSSWSRRDDAGALVHGSLLVTAVDEGRLSTVLRVQKLQ